MSIKAKTGLAVACCLAMAGLANAAIAGIFFEDESQRAAKGALRQAAEAYGALERAEVAKLSAALEAVAANRILADAFVRRDRPALLAASAPLFERLQLGHGVTHWYFIEPEPASTCFLRVHRPALHGDVVERATLAEAVRTRGTASGRELGKTAFALRVTRPWYFQGRVIGYLELGEEMEQFLFRMRAQTGDDYALVLDKRYLDAAEWAAVHAGEPVGWGARRHTVMAESTLGDRLLDYDGPVDAVPAEGSVLGFVEDALSSRVRGVVPVRDASARVVGGLVVLHDVTAARLALARERLWVLAVALASSVAAAVLLVLLLDRLVFRRLAGLTRELVDLPARLARGDAAAGVEAAGQARDEIGDFEALFARFLQTIAPALRWRAPERVPERRGDGASDEDGASGATG